jgi:hypothetical protein
MVTNPDNGAVEREGKDCGEKECISTGCYGDIFIELARGHSHGLPTTPCIMLVCRGIGP